MFYIIFFSFILFMYIDAYKQGMTHDNNNNNLKK